MPFISINVFQDAQQAKVFAASERQNGNKVKVLTSASVTVSDATIDPPELVLDMDGNPEVQVVISEG